MSKQDYEKIGRIIYSNQRLFFLLEGLLNRMSGQPMVTERPASMLLAKVRYEGEKYFSVREGAGQDRTRLFDVLEMARELDACQSGLERRSPDEIDRLQDLCAEAHAALAGIGGDLGTGRVLSA
jgi:hypothetical protein